MNREAKILVFASYVHGGLAEHVYYQMRALAKAGADVRCLVAPSFLPGRQLGVPAKVVLADPAPENVSRASRRLRQMWSLMFNAWRLAIEVWRKKPDLVLLDSFVEYLSPLWIWPHWFLARFAGVRYAANLHDPVRNYQLGPRWWHRLSVRLAYAPLDFVLVHHALPEPSPVPATVRVVEAPVGIYEVRRGSESREEWRTRHGVDPAQKMFLAFGHVRDGKNLHLVIEALAGQPNAVFVMAGSLQSAADRGFSYYKQVAAGAGVAERCRFLEGFVPDDEVAALFDAADFVVLTYSSRFRSQSGVLNVAARCRKPVLASSGQGPLCETVKKFQLGVAVAPDSLEEIARGMARLFAEPLQPMWDDYEEHASWDANVRAILNAAGLEAEKVES